MPNKEVQVRELLDLPACWCGEGVRCPEIILNKIGHPNEALVDELLEAE